MSNHIEVTVQYEEGFNTPNRLEQLTAQAKSSQPDIARKAKHELYTRTIAMRDFLALEQQREAQTAAETAQLEKTAAAMGNRMTFTKPQAGPDLSGVQPFGSRNEMADAISNRRYETDEAYRAEVARRTMVSGF